VIKSGPALGSNHWRPPGVTATAGPARHTVPVTQTCAHGPGPAAVVAPGGRARNHQAAGRPTESAVNSCTQVLYGSVPHGCTFA